MEGCLFCKIASGEVPASKIFDEGGFVAFLDLYPANKGHVLVIPTAHCERVEDLAAAQAQGLVLAVQRVSKALMKSLGCPAVNILSNSGKEAGQIIPHAHMHVIPRFEKDG
ncbi:MAG: HIT domain-containing protein, partial [Candidatus Micrarchaeota archaeon]